MTGLGPQFIATELLDGGDGRAVIVGTDYPAGELRLADLLNLANPNIRWQENTQQNYGVDLDPATQLRRLQERLALADLYVARIDGELLRVAQRQEA